MEKFAKDLDTDESVSGYKFCLAPTNYIPAGNIGYSKSDTPAKNYSDITLDEKYWEEWDREHPNGHSLSDFF